MGVRQRDPCVFFSSSEIQYFLNDLMHPFSSFLILANKISALLFLLVVIIFPFSGEVAENHLLK